MSSTDDGSWSTYDKLAGLFALALFSGYFLQPVESAVVASVSPVLSALAVWVPFSLFVIVLAGTTGLYTAILQTKLRDTERLERLQQRMKTLQERLKTAREDGDDEELEDLRSEQQELMVKQLGLMKESVRPMVWSLLVTAPVFLWLRWAVTSPAAAVAPVGFFLPLLGHVAWTATVVGPLQVWLVWYVGASISSSYVARKVVQRAV